MEARKTSGELQDMPALYFERTDAAEQGRHGEKLRRLAGEGGLLIDLFEGREGAWHVELVTTDPPTSAWASKLALLAITPP